MDAIENKPLRLIRLDRETEKAEVVEEYYYIYTHAPHLLGECYFLVFTYEMNRKLRTVLINQ
jgi:hypothetical protein